MCVFGCVKMIIKKKEEIVLTKLIYINSSNLFIFVYDCRRGIGEAKLQLAQVDSNPNSISTSSTGQTLVLGRKVYLCNFELFSLLIGSISVYPCVTCFFLVFKCDNFSQLQCTTYLITV